MSDIKLEPFDENASREDLVQLSLEQALDVNGKIFADRLMLVMGNGGEIYGAKQCNDSEYLYLMIGMFKKDPKLLRLTFKAILLAMQELGNPEWGAPKDEKVFIIRLGERVS